MMAFTPAKVSFIGELEGGSDDYEDLYCPTVEWDWGDDTTSESTVQCEPYQRGSSRIQRRFTVLHEFKIAGAYTIRLKLKKKNKVIISAQVSLQIHQGVRDPGSLVGPAPLACSETARGIRVTSRHSSTMFE